MRIATFNAASIRARLPRLLEWLAENEPDVLAVQETKVEDAKFPASEFEDLGYEAAIHGQKAWNGVAILSRLPISDVRPGFGDDFMPNDCRILAATVEGIRIVNTYVPNGNTVGSDKWDYKMRWLERFRPYVESLATPSDPLLWLGDINIARHPIDVYDSAKVAGGVGHHPDEFSRLDRILEFGLTDVFRLHTPEGGHFTYWDFVQPRAVERNIGWRIDHIYATAPLADRCTACTIDVEARKKEKPSDHTFVTAEFDL